MQLVWSKCNIGWKKPNVDKYAKKNSLATARFIISDNRQWILCFLKFIGISHAKLAEAWSLCLGLEIASNLQIRKLEIEVYYPKIYNLKTNKVNNSHPLSILITKYRHLLSAFEEYRITKISRKHNSVRTASPRKEGGRKCCLELFWKHHHLLSQPMFLIFKIVKLYRSLPFGTVFIFFYHLLRVFMFSLSEQLGVHIGF